MKAQLFIHPKFAVGTVNQNIFSGFVEHIGRCVYDGLYEPGHPTADADGFRGDVAELVRGLDMPLTRYPGGNFVSGFDWKDSVGPVASRPARADYAWKALEPNRIGIDEFMKWCHLAKTMPFYAVNLGTGTAKSAQEAVEYCNADTKSYWCEQRRANGAMAPHGIKYWCLGNEMDGDWQIGHKTALEYGRIAHEAAKMMKWVDPSIKLSLCGSCSRGMATYGHWDTEVLDEAFEAVDYLSIHAYFGNRQHDLPHFLASPELLDQQIVDAVACCDAVSAMHKSDKKMQIALDEWNVWYRGDCNAHPETEWKAARPINEETYDMTDVLVIGGIIMTMMDHCDRLSIGCLAQTVNVIAPIMTRPGGPAWKQTIYYPFQLMSRYGRGIVLRQSAHSPAYAIKDVAAPVPFLKSAVIWHPESQEIDVFAINRSPDEKLDWELDFGGFTLGKLLEALEIHHDCPAAVNTETDEPVKPAPLDAKSCRVSGSTVKATLKPLSWNMIRLQAKE